MLKTPINLLSNVALLVRRVTISSSNSRVLYRQSRMSKASYLQIRVMETISRCRLIITCLNVVGNSSQVTNPL